MPARVAWAVTLVLLATPPAADPPVTSLRPQARPVTETTDQAIDPATNPAPGQTAITQSLRPVARPARVRRPARTTNAAPARGSRRTSVCGDIALQGEAIGQVPATLKGCGITQAVRLRSVSGVVLSQPATMNCETARALKQWVDTGLQPAFRDSGPVTGMRIAAGYACRTRNSIPGARISEHGKGRAIDISGFTFAGGGQVNIRESWGKGATGARLGRAYAAACGAFRTTLGPASDAWHRDHFHFDTAAGRRAPYCH